MMGTGMLGGGFGLIGMLLYLLVFVGVIIGVIFLAIWLVRRVGDRHASSGDSGGDTRR